MVVTLCLLSRHYYELAQGALDALHLPLAEHRRRQGRRPAKPNQNHPDLIKPNQSKSNKIKPNQTKLDQAKAKKIF
jgi:hypothetical protein